MSSHIEPLSTVILQGIRDGLPIAFGYFAVSFSLGIAAGQTGISAIQAFFASALCNASAGEFAGFGAIAEQATVLSLILVTIVANARYLLMSCALSERCAGRVSILHRLLLSFFLTDEFFAIAVARKNGIHPFYTYGAVMIASPCWAIGTALGVIAGNMLPESVVSALAVSLFGMFIAIVIPPGKTNRPVAIAVFLSFVSSYIATLLPVVSEWSSGTRVIILTLVIAGLIAWLFPITADSNTESARSAS